MSPVSSEKNKASTSVDKISLVNEEIEEAEQAKDRSKRDLEKFYIGLIVGLFLMIGALFATNRGWNLVAYSLFICGLLLTGAAIIGIRKDKQEIRNNNDIIRGLTVERNIYLKEIEHTQCDE